MIDVLIIGAGGAGLSAALSAKKEGASVIVVNKSYPTQSQTAMAQGAINAALGNEEEDYIALHIADTLKSAHQLADETMVRRMCADAPDTIKWLDSLGVLFSRKEKPQENLLSSFAQRKMGGASAKRACYAQDYTGLKILHSLYEQCLKEEIPFLHEHYLLELITEKDSKNTTIKGAIFLEIQSGEIKEIYAKSVIIATGGYGGLYHGFTTNSYGSSGDGIAAVLRAGGVLSDMEFIQFHPTALKHSSILVSESARGEGGYLVNSKGERFIDELLPRDKVARAIFQEQKSHDVFLDLRHLGEKKLMELLPQEVHLCRLHEKVDPISECIPIQPVAHYTMGGIDVDEALEVNGIQGCFAVGECSNAKIHGANRLGGNSLLEIISFGRFAGENALKYARYASSKEPQKTPIKEIEDKIQRLFSLESHTNFYPLRKTLGEILYKKVGIIRDNHTLQEALEETIQMQLTFQKMGVLDKTKQNNQNLVEYLEFENALLITPTIISSAITRNESRGAHYKKDFEEENPTFEKHIHIQWKEV
jgi:succinate dehydrogenase / fumarate reductase flavoprotein subunit